MYCLGCVDGFFGQQCNLTCDYCNKSSPGCQQADGHCLHGCTYDLKLPKCCSKGLGFS